MDSVTSLANMYFVFMSTPILESDIKNIRKINNTFQKYIRSGKDSYILEIYNILHSLNNSVNINDAEEFILDYVDNDIKDKISFIIKKVK